MSNNPTHKTEWDSLLALSQNQETLNDLFQKNPNRFSDFSLELDGLYFDYSKQRIDNKILDILISLAQKSNIEHKRNQMFIGEKINITENRAVLHTALRKAKNETVKVYGKNIIPEIHKTLERIEDVSTKIRNHCYLGATGKPITQIVSIGIGGSDLGPRMVYRALKNQKEPVEIFFTANVDGNDIEETIQLCNPETTLFVIISKSFKSQETLINAHTARQWLQEKLGKDKDISNHFIAVSSQIDIAYDFGIKKENIYPMWDWVSGRFSLWSAVGLPIAMGLGFNIFSDLLKGARFIDTHFIETPLIKNIPIIMALVGIWNRNFLNASHQAILPYAHKLSLFPAYLQQLEMESNGKTVDLNETPIKDYKTGNVIFGESGTNGQHSFYQLIHQGSDLIPCDFIGFIELPNPYKNHHQTLTNHMLAQGQALMQGKCNSNDLHRHFKGNIPSTTILLNRLDALHLGMLIALYEHKVFVQGVIWNINSFDQFGVELGKEMVKNIENSDFSTADSSTKELYSRIHKKDK